MINWIENANVTLWVHQSIRDGHRHCLYDGCRFQHQPTKWYSNVVHTQKITKIVKINVLLIAANSRQYIAVHERNKCSAITLPKHHCWETKKRIYGSGRHLTCQMAFFYDRILWWKICVTWAFSPRTRHLKNRFSAAGKINAEQLGKNHKYQRY